MVVAAGNGAEITGLNDLVHVYHSLLCRNLVDLGHLSFSLLIDFFVLSDGLIGKLDQHIRWLARRLHKEAANTLLLFYKTRQKG